MKNEKMKWYFLIAAALVVGAMVGYFATNSLSTTGNAKATLNAKVTSPTCNIDPDRMFVSHEVLPGSLSEKAAAIAKEEGLDPKIVLACMETGDCSHPSLRLPLGRECLCPSQPGSPYYGSCSCDSSCAGGSCRQRWVWKKRYIVFW